MNLAQKLKSVGIPCTVTNVTDERQIFTMENDTNRKKINIVHPEHVEVTKVAVSKANKQAVLHIKEDGGIHIETVTVRPKGKTGFKTKKEALNAAQSKLEVDKRRTLIVDSTFTIDSIDTKKDGSQWIGVAGITVTSPDRTNCFLVGKDERHTFICQLPEIVNSVVEAHKVLRPTNISRKAIRIGEWFFDPLSDKEIVEMIPQIEHQYYEGDNIVTCDEWTVREGTLDLSLVGDDIYWEDLRSDNHQAQLAAYTNDNVYVMGKISDSRDTHKDVFLDRWHRVVHNRELINDSEKWD